MANAMKVEPLLLWAGAIECDDADAVIDWEWRDVKDERARLIVGFEQEHFHWSTTTTKASLSQVEEPVTF